MRLGPELDRVLSGEQTFDQFAKHTMPRWEQLARYLMRRWQVPVGVSLEDIVQELLLAAWIFAPKWDPNRGVSLEAFIVFNTCDKAKKWMHRQRNALRRDDSKRGRFPVAFTLLASGDEDDPSERLMAMSPEVETMAEELDREHERAENMARNLAPLKPRDQYLALAALKAQGDVHAAAREVYGDTKSRLHLRLESEESTRAAMRRALSRAAKQPITEQTAS